MAAIIILLALLGAILLWAGLSGTTPAEVIRVWTKGSGSRSGGSW